jgi:BarA-like signal transduction histidine kinase
MLKTFAQSLAVACLALAAGAFAIAQAPAQLLTVRPYHVTTAVAFPSLPLPVRSLIFRNGLYQTPGADYDVVAAGLAFRFRLGVLADGDALSVVSLAP